MGNWYTMQYQSHLSNEILEDQTLSKKFYEFMDESYVELFRMRKYEDRFWVSFNAYDKHGDGLLMKICKFLDPYILSRQNRGRFVAIIQDDYQECGDNYDCVAKLVMKGNDYYTIPDFKMRNELEARGKKLGSLPVSSLVD